MNENIHVFVERDPATIMAECKVQLEELLGRSLQPAQVEQTMLQFIVYRETLLANRFNAGLSQLLLQFSSAPVIDYIAALVSVERLPAATAECTLSFTLVEGHGPVLLPESTRVATADGEVIFQTVEEVIIPATTNAVVVKATAEAEGLAANGYAPGTVNKILDPLAFVQAVTNINETAGGSDTETDDHLRERVKLAPSQYSTAGSRASYIFHAKSANALIKDVAIPQEPPVPGTVLIAVLTDYDQTPQQVLDDVYAACGEEKVRPLTDTVIVQSASAVEYDIHLQVTLYENANAVEETAVIENSLRDYAKSKRDVLGQDIVLSHISQKARTANVYDVTIVSPAENLVISETEFGLCKNITVEIIGYNRG